MPRGACRISRPTEAELEGHAQATTTLCPLQAPGMSTTALATVRQPRGHAHAGHGPLRTPSTTTLCSVKPAGPYCPPEAKDRIVRLSGDQEPSSKCVRSTYSGWTASIEPGRLSPSGGSAWMGSARWVIPGGQWSWATSDRRVAWPVWWWCQIAAVRPGCAPRPEPTRPRACDRRGAPGRAALEGVVDRLDRLPRRLEQRHARPLGLARARRSQRPHARLCQDALDLAAVVVLVGHQQLLPWPDGDQVWLDGRQVQLHLAVGGLAPVGATATGRAVQGADQVQPQPRTSVHGWHPGRSRPTRPAPNP